LNCFDVIPFNVALEKVKVVLVVVYDTVIVKGDVKEVSGTTIDDLGISIPEALFVKGNADELYGITVNVIGVLDDWPST
jgi:hypothetical protein